jgi:hypothetical protein
MALVRDLFGLEVDERSYAPPEVERLAEVHQLPAPTSRRR